MREKMGSLIEKVVPKSPACNAGIKVGWRLLRIDNQPIGDIIDYKIMESDENLRLILQTDQGILRRVKVRKPAGKPLGLGFDPPTITKMQSCRNKCIFCFIEQNPSGLRSALYVKDDDYRLSFLYGNFITLNRLTNSELDRIIKLQLSPLYVSVHTTDPELRKVMFGTNTANKGMSNLKLLIRAGIRVHAQVVLCPGYNTGETMEQTIRDLDRLGPNLEDIALVPVGLTGHRSGLIVLHKFVPEEAKMIIRDVEQLQLEYLKKRNSRFVFLADEFYITAGFEFPADDHYEAYPQLENGVGLGRQFLNELAVVADEDKPVVTENIMVSVAAGKAAETLMKKLVKEFELIDSLTFHLYIIENCFFGDEVDVSGLLTGADLLYALEEKDLGDLLFISNTMLRDNSGVFLDDMTIGELEQRLKVSVLPVSGPAEMMDRIRDFAADSKLTRKRGSKH